MSRAAAELSVAGERRRASLRRCLGLGRIGGQAAAEAGDAAVEPREGGAARAVGDHRGADHQAHHVPDQRLCEAVLHKVWAAVRA